MKYLQPLYYKYSLLFVITALFFFSAIDLSYSQIKSTFRNDQTKNIDCIFTLEEIHFNKGEMISNVLKVKNISTDTIRFFIDFSYPAEWKSLLFKNKQYTVLPNDSVFIPVRLLPRENVKGSTRYFINAFLVNQDGKQLAYSYFFAFTEKKISWSLEALPSTKLYFLNNENTVRFHTSIVNTGNEPQEILFLARDIPFQCHLLDTNEKLISKPVYNFKLVPLQDTTKHFIFSYDKKPRNYRRVDLENYNPFSLNNYKKYSFTLLSKEPISLSSKAGYAKSRKMEIVKLSDNMEINQYGSLVFPLVFDANIYNILNDNTMMSLDLHGNSYIGNGNLYYSTLLMYRKNYYSDAALKYAPFNISYTKEKYSLGLGTSGSGTGLWANYRINSWNQVSAMLTSGPRVFSKRDYNAFSVGHSLKIPFTSKLIKNASIQTQYLFAQYNPIKFTMHQINVKPSINIYKVHLGGVFNYIYLNGDTSKTRSGYGIVAGYGDNFFKKKLDYNISGSYYNNIYNNFNSFNLNYVSYYRSFFASRPQYNLNSRTEYKIKEGHNLTLFNIFYSQPVFNTGTVSYDQQSFYNQLLYQKYFSTFSVSTGLFYNINSYNKFEAHSRGVSINSSSFQIEKNIRVSFNSNFGYNYAPTELDKHNYFFVQSSFISQIRALNLMVFYNYGNVQLSRYALNQGTKYPQRISVSGMYQYIFPNPSFVLEYRTTYTYANLTGHSMSVIPDFYFFSRNGWRFKFGPEYYFSFKNNIGNQNSYVLVADEEIQSLKPKFTNSLNVTVGIRKEFGIPIPFIKSKRFSPEFQAFMDLNGNKLFDKGEQVLENVVIRVNGYELITNEKGKAKITNIDLGAYTYTVFSLVDLEGWFPSINDSIIIVNNNLQLVPFNKGVKIYGSVMAERERYGSNVDQPLDLSKIKIMASGTKTFASLTDGNANYSIFLPYGKYTLTLDESILGNRYKLVENNFELTIDEKIDNLYVPFYIVEKKRKINIQKFENPKANDDNPDIRKKEIEDKRKQDELNKKKLDELNRLKQDELNRRKLEEEKKKQDELERKRLEDEKNKINKAKTDSSKNDSSKNELKKNKDGVIDLTSQGEVNSDDIKNLTNAIKNKMAGKKDKKTEEKKPVIEKKKEETKVEEIVKKDVSSLKELNRKINKDDFNDVEIDGLLYRCQVAASNTEVPTNWLRNQFNLKSDVYLFRNDDGLYNYCLGDFTTKGEAMKYNEKFIMQKKINSFITYYYNNKRVPYKIIEQVYQSIIDEINQEKSQQNNNTQQLQNDSLKQLQKDTIKMLKDTLNK